MEASGRVLSLTVTWMIFSVQIVELSSRNFVFSDGGVSEMDSETVGLACL